ncbi:Retinoblastoma-like protein 1 [Leptotrombidium deliense]|uniref:Retinoblastoma-like protein 1 n=1 Tax=Leptotrombidium deliense TaxID=299467 RepID=A0A443SCR0_9ACAR|nr:Retinoblastoma-like protein 1 [Leptotrombidium deliense]
MGASKGDQETAQLMKKYKEVCADLNLDKTAADEALTSFQRIGINYTLEGDKLHWLACALYVACRNERLPTVGGRGDYIEGNCVSLTRLLRSCKLSLVQFFNKMKKWSDMANLRHDMRNKIDHLERNFNVSTFIFKKFKPIFLDIFKDPACVPPKTKSRKQSRKQSITSSDVFSFCWTFFVYVKSNFPAISDDLVNSYHLLLACVDLCYSNALVAENAKDLLNPEFSELPADFENDDFVFSENMPCIINVLCEKWQGIFVDAKGIKEHWLKPHIKRLVEKKVMKCRNSLQLIGFFDPANFDANGKSITKEYDQYVLNIGDFDERIFLCDNAHQELGTPQTNLEEFNEKMQMRKRIEEAKTLAPTTPLSNRHYLRNREVVEYSTPVSNATQTVSRLQTLLLGRKNEPSQALVELFQLCKSNPEEELKKRVKELGDKFVDAYSQPLSDDHMDYQRGPQPNEFGKKRLELGVTLYYKTLEAIIMREKKKLDDSKISDILCSLLSNELFHVSLFACCIEIVLYSYNSQRTFPWIIDVLGDFRNLHFQAFHFYKVIELLIREEDGLSRDVVKHMNSIEEQILDSLAWKNESALWDLIRTQGPVPSCQNVTVPNSSDMSPVHASPTSRRVVRETPFQSPLPNPIASDRFESPVNSSARRRLFDTESGSGEIQIPANFVPVSIQTRTNTGELKVINAYIANYGAAAPSQSNENSSSQPKINVTAKPLKTGPLGLFFRKVYNSAWLRLYDLCNRLNIVDDDLKRKIWTCFEFSICNHTDLMRDRHLDQLVMCAIYSICKVTKKDQSFTELMRVYRLQPQAQSHVYRSVLLTNRSRRNSASSDNSRNSGQNSPTQEERERIRSSSTLPVPHPNSQPPTPTRLAGTGSQFEFGEERGDLIMFYNKIYVPEMKTYIMKFNSENGSPPLSPLPRVAANPISPYRRISSKHSLYISPMKTANFPPSPKRPMSYCFLRSPAKDLKAINTMLRSSGDKRGCKRILEDEMGDGDFSPIRKRTFQENNFLSSKIQDIYSERQERVASGGQS